MLRCDYRRVHSRAQVGLPSLLAQSHFLLARALELSGNAAKAQGHSKQARQVADSIQREEHADTITKRSDLSQSTPTLLNAPRTETWMATHVWLAKSLCRNS